MGTVLLVPGILGNHLVVPRPGRVPPLRLWLSYPELAAYGFARLRLQEDGLAEFEETFRGRVVAGDAQEFYYGSLRDTVSRAGWKWGVFGYDWRKSITSAGQALADVIAGEHSPGGVHLVGHSMGGLVARWAHSRLVAVGKGTLVKRIVTLGTPAFGSYGIVMAFSHLGELYKQLVAGVIGARLLMPTLVFLNAQVDAPLCSWPGAYQLMPDPLGPSSTVDPARATLYLPSTWSDKSPAVVARHLEAVPSFWNAMRQALPTAGVLVTVLGRGADTPLRTRSGNFWNPDDYVQADGDNTVTVEDGTPANMPTATVRGAHESLGRHPVILSRLNDWLTKGLDRSIDHAGEFIR